MVLQFPTALREVLAFYRIPLSQLTVRAHKSPLPSQELGQIWQMTAIPAALYTFTACITEHVKGHCKFHPLRQWEGRCYFDRSHRREQRPGERSDLCRKKQCGIAMWTLFMSISVQTQPCKLRCASSHWSSKCISAVLCPMQAPYERHGRSSELQLLRIRRHKAGCEGTDRRV